MPRREGPGILTLSYARSAGSGDQPVQGLVTSRRDRGKQQRQKVLQQQRVEEERRDKERQKAAEMILKRKWAEEDREDKKKRHKSSDDEVNEEDEFYEHRGDEDRNISSMEAIRHGKENETMDEEGGANGSGTGWQLVEDKGYNAATNASSSSTKVSSAEPHDQASGSAPSRTPAKPIPVFGFGLEDEDDDCRERELLAEKERARARKRSAEALRLHSVRQAAGPASGGGQLGPQALDAYQQLKKLADWKRSCGGERRPMPREMMDELAAVAERQGGRHIA